MNYKLQDKININNLKKILTKINDTFCFTITIIDNNKKLITHLKFKKIFTELEQKNKISHRSKAIENALPILYNLYTKNTI